MSNSRRVQRSRRKGATFVPCVFDLVPATPRMTQQEEVSCPDDIDFTTRDAWEDAQSKLQAFADEPSELHLDRLCDAVRSL